MKMASEAGAKQASPRKLERTVQPSGREISFDDSEFIVSKTDLKGHITYANRTFLKISGFDEEDILGAPHSVIRHPDMPRCVFKLLWEKLTAGKEIFAYVNNLAKNGDNYWVFAHVTPSYDSGGSPVGYHSNRRVPDRKVLEGTIIPLYRGLLDVEAQAPDRKVGLAQSHQRILDLLQEKGMDYDELVFSL